MNRLRHLPGGLAAAPVVVRGASSAAPRDWKIVDHVRAERVAIQAHRGGVFLAQENNVAASELGGKPGCHLQCDVRTTTGPNSYQRFPYTSDSSVNGQLLDRRLTSFATDDPDVIQRELRANDAAKIARESAQ